MNVEYVVYILQESPISFSGWTMKWKTIKGAMVLTLGG